MNYLKFWNFDFKIFKVLLKYLNQQIILDFKFLKLIRNKLKQIFLDHCNDAFFLAKLLKYEKYYCCSMSIFSIFFEGFCGLWLFFFLYNFWILSTLSCISLSGLRNSSPISWFFSCFLLYFTSFDLSFFDFLSCLYR